MEQPGLTICNSQKIVDYAQQKPKQSQLIMMLTRKHALIVPLYGEITTECINRLKQMREKGYEVIVVNNNPVGYSIEGIIATKVVPHHNLHGLAGGFNAGVSQALADGADCVTLLDQDSIISSESLIKLARGCGQKLVVGPRIIDRNRNTEHTSANRKARMLISSGTTFTPDTWKRVGKFREWMEIDYIDHDWCGRARSAGINLEVVEDAVLFQTFGCRHPNILAHILGLQLYSPYRRSIAMRNLRWLVLQHCVPLDVRLKEVVKMLMKPWIWLILEPRRRRCLGVIWLA